MIIREGWRTVRLGDVADTQLGKMLDSKKDRGGPRYRYLRNENVQWGRIESANLQEVELGEEDLERFEVKDGDLLVCEGGDIGRAAIWRGDGRYLAYQKALHRVRSKGNLDLYFLRYLLEHLSRAGVLARLSTGTTIKHLPQQRLREMTISLPALVEQRRLVDMLEDHLSRLEAAERQLKRAQRQALLLTRAFIDRTLAERSTALDWRAMPLESLTDGSPRAIADGPFGSNLASAHYTDAGPLVVRLQNIGDGVFKRSDAHISPQRFEMLRAHSVVAGDVVVASLGEAIPRAAIVPAGLGPAIVKADCVRVRARSATMAAWVVASTRSSGLKQWAASRMHGVGRQRLGVAGIRALPILVPASEPELEPILRQISSLDEEAARLDVSISDQLRRSGALRRALLTAAFTGDLTGRASDFDRIEELADASHDSR